MEGSHVAAAFDQADDRALISRASLTALEVAEGAFLTGTGHVHPTEVRFVSLDYGPIAP